MTNAAAEAGWIVGYPDGTFRAEVVTLINRVLNRTLAPEEVPWGVNPYNDLVSSHWAYGDLIEASILHCMIDLITAGTITGAKPKLEEIKKYIESEVDIEALMEQFVIALEVSPTTKYTMKKLGILSEKASEQ